MRRKNLLALIGATLLLLSGCGKKLEPPELYQIGEDSALALPLPEGAILSAAELPEDEESTLSTYTYEKLPDTAAALQEYAGLLTEEGFSMLNEQGAVAEQPPDFTQPEGAVHLVKPASEDATLFKLDLNWTEEQCSISVCKEPGALPVPKVEPMTMRDAVEYLQSFSPAELGLDGKDMREYNIYPKVATAYVDGVACLEMAIYRNSHVNTNDIVAIYLLSGDKAELYRLDPTDGTVIRL